MEQLLKHFRIMNIPTEDNPLVTLNVSRYQSEAVTYLFVAKCQNTPSNYNSQNETLCVAAVDIIISEPDLKFFFSKFGTIKSFNFIGREQLSKNFKKFAYCTYIMYEEENVVDVILTYTVDMNDYFKSNIQAPYFISIERKNFSYYLKKYYDNYYNLCNERKIIIKEITNLNADNKGKKKLDLIDEDGFTVVHRNTDKTEFINSIFSPTNEKCNYLKKKRKSPIHENFYLFQKKDTLKNKRGFLIKKK
ncbi:hypothetical protein POVCU2_0029990 [Plasmodium ovale curtisi]|uniref:Ribosomal RNA-processing protein 7 C-terminal domain-containing protein n=2 Tax=Plasmodium ovale TaxID=36330 RepID=A0A1A8WP33_PLAOA|nr:hypothetical protein POVCU2_0029990 [Plasmodium ovale curtisi]SBS94034.1 hypothetical protein POVCU1_027300 [Plasmodium ovale curtisi]